MFRTIPRWCIGLPRIRRPAAQLSLQAGIAAVAVLCPVSPLTAAVPLAQINGGGAVASAPVIINELLLTNDIGSTAFYFRSYYPVTSTVFQTALINNDATQFGLPAGSESVHFGAAEQPLSSAQLSSWANLPTGRVAAGNLLQIPLMGAGLAIPIVNRAVTGNGQLVLSDDQLCGVFSGKLFDWSQVNTNLASGPITVVYRPESTALSYQLTQHLAAVCTTTNSNFAVPFAASTYFVSLFTNYKPPANFKAVKGLTNTAQDLNTVETSAIGYISPDWTTIDPTSNALLPSGARSTLVVAALSGTGSAAYLPNVADITVGLANPGPTAINAAPPTNAAAASNASNWLPLIPTTRRGYPIVSYSTMNLPQCFADKRVAKGLKLLLHNHYYISDYQSIQRRNGYVQITNTPAAAFLRAIVSNLLKNVNGWNVDIQNTAACATVPGR